MAEAGTPSHGLFQCIHLEDTFTSVTRDIGLFDELFDEQFVLYDNNETNAQCVFHALCRLFTDMHFIDTLQKFH